MNLLAYLPLSSDVVLDFVAQYAPGNTMKLIENNVRHIIETQNVTLLSFRSLEQFGLPQMGLMRLSELLIKHIKWKKTVISL